MFSYVQSPKHSEASAIVVQGGLATAQASTELVIFFHLVLQVCRTQGL